MQTYWKNIQKGMEPNEPVYIFTGEFVWKEDCTTAFAKHFPSASENRARMQKWAHRLHPLTLSKNETEHTPEYDHHQFSYLPTVEEPCR